MHCSDVSIIEFEQVNVAREQSNTPKTQKELKFNWNTAKIQKQPLRGVPRKRCSENM